VAARTATGATSSNSEATLPGRTTAFDTACHPILMAIESYSSGTTLRATHALMKGIVSMIISPQCSPCLPTVTSLYLPTEPLVVRSCSTSLSSFGIAPR